MDNKALYKLSYGVFFLASKGKTNNKANGCITNTCIQVANSPTRVAVSVLNTNYTCGLIKESGVFTISLLDETTTFETIKHWGFQSGRNVDKLEGLNLPTDINGVVFLPWQTTAVISCKVIEKHELGSHTLFIAEVVDAKVLSEKNPLTYSDYQNNLKPKSQSPAKENKIIGWKCKICGHIYNGNTLPEDYLCPICGHSKDDFEPIYEN